MCSSRLCETCKGESPTKVILFYPPLILLSPASKTETSYKQNPTILCVFYFVCLHSSKALFLVELKGHVRLIFDSKVVIFISWTPMTLEELAVSCVNVKSINTFILNALKSNAKQADVFCMLDTKHSV